MAGTITQPVLLDYGIDSDYTDVAITLGKLSVKGGVFPKVTTTVKAYAAAADLTLTATQLLGGHLQYDPAGASRTLVTPTGALLDTPFTFKYTGTSIDFVLENTADAYEVLTLTGGVGVTLTSGDDWTVHPGQRKFVRLTKTGDGTYTGYVIGADRPMLTNHVNYDNVAVAATDDVLTVVNLVNGTDSPDAQVDIPRNLVVTIVDTNPSITVGTVTITGIGVDGDAVSEVFDCADGAGTYTGSVIFATVNASGIVTTDFATLGGAGDETIGVGGGTKLGLPCGVQGQLSNVFKACVAGADEAVGTVDCVNKSIIPTTAPNDTRDYDFWYRHV